jgi:threonine synthase
MRFVSTRGNSPEVGFLQAVEQGLAPDGGLYMPAHLPDISEHLAKWEGLGYPELAARFFSLFSDEFSSAEWSSLTAAAYRTFAHPDIAPLVPMRGRKGLYALELFHGPTLAFKDFALQLLGLLYKELVRKSGRTFTVLGATSGDTGSAAIYGCMGQEGITIVILYPDGRVAPLQERQMACTGARNVVAVPIPGTFDDAQAIVKALFGDTEFARAHRLAAVNSINISRVLAQSVYYIHAWLRLPKTERERGVQFIVPTGNFGNVFAGWLASRMGLPGCAFRVATNRNDILHRFFSAGDYSVAAVEPSLAPSMDIQLASNFERFLYATLDGDSAATARAMAHLKASGRLPADLPASARTHFTSSRMDDAGIRSTIAHVYRDFGYVVCPHTACGFGDLTGAPEGGATIVLATAHPAKFPEAVLEATGLEPKHPVLEELRHRPLERTPCAATPEAVRKVIEKAVR